MGGSGVFGGPRGFGKVWKARGVWGGFRGLGGWGILGRSGELEASGVLGGLGRWAGPWAEPQRAKPRPPGLIGFGGAPFWGRPVLVVRPQCGTTGEGGGGAWGVSGGPDPQGGLEGVGTPKWVWGWVLWGSRLLWGGFWGGWRPPSVGRRDLWGSQMLGSHLEGSFGGVGGGLWETRTLPLRGPRNLGVPAPPHSPRTAEGAQHPQPPTRTPQPRPRAPHQAQTPLRIPRHPKNSPKNCWMGEQRGIFCTPKTHTSPKIPSEPPTIPEPQNIVGGWAKEGLGGGGSCTPKFPRIPPKPPQKTPSCPPHLPPRVPF